MLHLAAQVEEAAAAIRDQWKRPPRAGIILGTGIGPLVQEIETEASIDYEQIPHFLRATATGHPLACHPLACHGQRATIHGPRSTIQQTT